MQIYDELVERGLIAQTTNEEEIKKLVNDGKAVFYIGFDPTADSLHVGHFMALCLMKRLQEAGNKPVVLVGGGTGMIGDPSGRTDLRKMMTVDTINHNVECFKKQMSRFIDFNEGKAIIVNNADWLTKLNYIDFLRDIGPHFSVNRMLAAECYKQRMEQGLTFLEFNYMLMQAYDFYRLFQDYGCNMQFGGDDQWSNMLAGTELIRRKLGKDSHAMTITLLTNSEGKKMGKTANGAVWLDPNKTSPYEFYQYWRNVDDSDVIKCIKLLTFLPLDEIHKMEKWEGADLNKAKDILAYELTSLVHGKEEGEKCREAAKALFSGHASLDNMPTLELKNDDLTDDKIELAEILVKSKLCSSKGDARRNIEQGGVLINDDKILDTKKVLSKDELLGDGKIIKKGKKNFLRVFLSSLVLCTFFAISTFATNTNIILDTPSNISENMLVDSNLQTLASVSSLTNQQTENTIINDSLNISFLDQKKTINYNNLINPYTNENVTGYIIKENVPVTFSFTNPETANVPIKISQYYLEPKDNVITKILLKEAILFPGIPIDLLPQHTINSLSKSENKQDKLFVIETSFHTCESNPEIDTVIKQDFYYKYLDEKDFDSYKYMDTQKKNTTES